VGRMLALSDRVSYIHEPFNPGWKTPGIFGAKFTLPFTYINANNESLYLDGVQKTLSFQYNWFEGIKHDTHKEKHKRFLVASRNLIYYSICRMMNKRPLQKDPLALFSAEWLAARFDMSVIVLIRHPAAFVDSIIAKGWRQPFEALLKQDRLMEGHLSQFRDEIIKYAEGNYSIADEASVMWKILYAQVRKYQKNHPEWCFVRHEDLSIDPVGEYAKLFDYIAEPYTEKIIRTIRIQSGLEQRGRVFNRNVFRDSRENVTAWKQKLSQEEIDVIRKNTEDVAKVFYANDEW
jgi:hypothetical protein